MWRIRDWTKHFENNRTRELKLMLWVPIPTKLDGDGFTELMEHKNGAAHYGAWITCVHVAAKSQPRGSLIRSGGVPHTFASLSRITRVPKSILSEAIPRLIEIGWMESVQDEECQHLAATPQEGAACLRDDCGSRACPMEWNGMEGMEGQNTPKAPKGADVCSCFDAFWNVVARHKRKDRCAAEKAYAATVKLLSARSNISDPHTFLLERATAYYGSQHGQTSYCHQPAIWLNRGGYDDDSAAWQYGDSPAEPEEPPRKLFTLQRRPPNGDGSRPTGPDTAAAPPAAGGAGTSNS